jgi:hypothetical protein
MSASAQLVGAGLLFTVMALWAWRECVMYRKHGVRVEAEVVRKRISPYRGRQCYKIMCQYAPPRGPIQMSEQSVWYSDWVGLSEGEMVRIVYNPKSPGRWVLEGTLDRLALAPVGLGLMAAGCFVAALMARH